MILFCMTAVLTFFSVFFSYVIKLHNELHPKASAWSRKEVVA
ncbi:MAG TPA: hypothetical protein PLM56_14570 [Cyclobacteriaceae bacterium]|jgi:hypothetical protein|nr:hypothetical protein [Cyclobacteriaceae bacterium]HRE65663.1 hypothetical protein [Cyclobacteriaceae bacterium]HRF34725.1 hypothetical protein [Cyclobacteriaceae bacterium]